MSLSQSFSRLHHHQGSHLDVDGQSMSSGLRPLGPGTSTALLAMRWRRPCGEDACPREGFQSHVGRDSVTLEDKKNIGLELPAVPLGAFRGVRDRWDTGVERVGKKKIKGPGEERVDEHPPSPHP